jgi:hypothetical protein
MWFARGCYAVVVNEGRFILQYVIEIRSENLTGDRTHQNKLLFYLPFFRKILLNPDKF